MDEKWTSVEVSDLLKYGVAIGEKVVQKFKQIVGVDTRSLALLRVMLGLTTLWDLCNRMRDIKAHYTDEGVMSRALVLEKYWNYWWVSPYMMSGTWIATTAVFLLNIVVAFCLLIGFRTTLSTFLAWVFVNGIQARNILVGHSGDILHRNVLLFSMFLPLGRHFSVDSVIEQRKNENVRKNLNQYLHVSIGGFGLMIQILIMYYNAYNHKVGVEWTTIRTSAWLALQLDFFRRPFGDLLLSIPLWMLKFFTFGVLQWQGWGPFFFFSPIFTEYLRLFGVIGFLTMHVAFAMAFRLGLFGWITISAILSLIPGLFWEQLFNLLKTKQRTKFKVCYLETSSFLDGFMPYLKLFLLPETEVHCRSFINQRDRIHKQENEEENLTWMRSVDFNGQVAYNFSALVETISVSPILWPLKFLFRIPFIFQFSNKLFLDIIQSNPIIRSKKTSDLDVIIDTSVRDTVAFNLPKSGYEQFVDGLKLFTKTLIFVVKNGLAALCVYIVLSWNAPTIGYPRWRTNYSLHPLVYNLHLEQDWAMFAPRPPDTHWWYNIEAELHDGRKVELFKNAAIWTLKPNFPHNWEKPGVEEGSMPFYESFKNHRWFKYFENGFNADNQIRLNFGRYLCREFNSVYNGNDRVWKFNIHWMNERMNLQTYDGSRIPGQKQTLWTHVCYDR